VQDAVSTRTASEAMQPTGCTGPETPTVGSWAHPRTCRRPSALGEPPTREVNHFLIHFCFTPNRENPDSSRAEPDFLQFRGLTVLTFEDRLYFVNDDTKDPKPRSADARPCKRLRDVMHRSWRPHWRVVRRLN